MGSIYIIIIIIITLKILKLSFQFSHNFSRVHGSFYNLQVSGKGGQCAKGQPRPADGGEHQDGAVRGLHQHDERHLCQLHCQSEAKIQVG